MDMNLQLQIGIVNAFDTTHVLNFPSIFKGTHYGPPRGWTARRKVAFRRLRPLRRLHPTDGFDVYSRGGALPVPRGYNLHRVSVAGKLEGNTNLSAPTAASLVHKIGSYYDNDRRDTSPFTADELLGRSFIVKYTRFDY